MVGNHVIPHSQPLVLRQHFTEQGLQQWPSIQLQKNTVMPSTEKYSSDHNNYYLRSDVQFDEVLQEVRVVVSQAILHHSQDVQRSIRKVLKPLTTPVHCNVITH